MCDYQVYFLEGLHFQFVTGSADERRALRDRGGNGADLTHFPPDIQIEMTSPFKAASLSPDSSVKDHSRLFLGGQARFSEPKRTGSGSNGADAKRQNFSKHLNLSWTAVTGLASLLSSCSLDHDLLRFMVEAGKQSR